MIGIDCVHIPRIQRILVSGEGPAFTERVLTLEERSCLQSGDTERLAEMVAELFAAKEAVIKASPGAVTIEDLNRICVAPYGRGKHKASTPAGAGHFHVSTCRFGEYAVAVAVACEAS